MGITYKFELNNRPGADGRHTIFLRITENRKIRRVKTSVAVKPAEFDKDAAFGQWISKNPYKKDYNDELVNLRMRVQTEMSDLRKVNAENAPALIERLQYRMPDGAWTLGTFAKRFIDEQAAHSVGYERHMKSHLTLFVDFAGTDLPLSAISLDTLNRFKRHLQKSGKLGSTQQTYLGRIKRLMQEALKLELIQKDPFLHFTMPSDKPQPRLKLSDVQVAAVEAVDVTLKPTLIKGKSVNMGIWLFRAKHLYLFAYQMGGIRSRDVLQLRWANLVGEKGNERLEYQMSKTGEAMSTRLTKKAREILELFRRPNSKPHDYLFGILDNEAPYAEYITYEQKKKMPRELSVKLFNDIGSVQTQINGELKTLAKRAGIQEKLTFHTARHSFADKARRKMKESKNVSIDDIRQALGHTRLDTTQRYLNSFDKESLDSAMDAIFGED